MKRLRQPGNGTVALLLGCAVALLLTATSSSIGLTWDEPAYIAASESYLNWFGTLLRDPSAALQPAAIDSYWTISHDHPPLDKTWSGLVWGASRPLLDDLTAHRLGNVLLAAILVALLFLLVAKAYGRASGLFAVGALMTMPRFFFHAHLAALDVPVAVCAFALTFLFWRTIHWRGWGVGLVWGAAGGLALATKFNALLIPVVFALWILLSPRSWSAVPRLFLMGIAAVPIFFLTWPWLYHQSWTRLLTYVTFHLNQPAIGQWYLGAFYPIPPWHFPFVMLWAVVPLTVTGLALLGAMQARHVALDDGLGLLFVLNSIVFISPFLLGRTSIYDDERFFMPVFPFVAALAGVGFGKVLKPAAAVLHRLNRSALLPHTAAALGVALLAPQCVSMVGLYPHLLSYYSEGVLGLPGATRLGLETTYWCETFAAAVPYINEHARPGDHIWISSGTRDVLVYYQLRGWLRADVTIVGGNWKQSVFGPQAPPPVSDTYQNSNWIIFQYRQSQYGPQGNQYPLLNYLKQLPPPVYQLAYQGVPLMQVYGSPK